MVRTRATGGNRGRGQGRGRGRGNGDGEPGAGNAPDMATVIAQTINAIMPTIVAQVTAALGNNIETQDGADMEAQDNQGHEAENV